MKKLSFPCLFFLAALLFTGCAGSSPTVAKQEVVGHWVSQQKWKPGGGEAGQKRPDRAETKLNLRQDGAYDWTFFLGQARPDWLVSKSSGTWEMKGSMLILNQTKVESGMVPKNPVRKITFEVVALTRTFLSVKRNEELSTYRRVD